MLQSAGGSTVKPAKDTDRKDPGDPAPQARDDVDAVAGLTDAERAHLVKDADTTWDVTYTDDTTLVTGDALRAVTSVDSASGRYTFDLAAAEAAGLDLDEGRVLLLAGQALRRITSSESRGSRITVSTEQASLSDVIEEGTVAWDVPIRFDFNQFVTDQAVGSKSGQLKPSNFRSHAGRSDVPQLAQISMAMPDGQVVPIQSAGEIADAIADSIEVKPEDGSVAWTYSADGNKYQFRLTSRGDAVDVLIVVSRGSDGDPTMAFRAEGTIGSLRSVSSSSYSRGSLASSKVAVDRLAIDVDLSIAAAGAGSAPVELTVPVPMLTFTWLVGPVPVTLDLKTDIVGTVKAEGHASATAKSSFTYRGDAGFEFKGTKVSTSGSTDIDSMDPEPADSAAPMGVNVDAQYGVAFPAVSLSVFGQGLVPKLHFGAFIGTDLTWGGPAAGFAASSICKAGYARMELVAGYDLEILGHNLGSDRVTLYEDRRDGKSDNCPDD